MFSEKNIVITIGDYGVVVALHDGKEIKNKIFLDALSDESKTELTKLFTSNKHAPIHVLLDTVDQSYKKKTYPSVGRADLKRIIKRDMASDADKDSIKNYIILDTKKPAIKSNHRWECLFVSSANSETVNKWIEFLLEMPNRLSGIYMLPIETFKLFQLMKSRIKAASKIKNKRNDVYCIIMQNKVSGIRQIAFSDQGIVFTRVVNYNFAQPDFLEKYEQDVYSTFEYLKRLFPGLAMNELDIVNILPEEALTSLKQLNSPELNLINYTPSKLASEIGYSKLLPQNSDFCDLLISKVFAKGKKYLKFSTPKISLLEKFFVTIQFSYYLNWALIMLICAAGVNTVTNINSIEESISVFETDKFSALQELTKVKSSALNDQNAESDEEVDIDRITDFGKVEELMSSVGINFIDFYTQLKFLKDFNLSLKTFSYSLAGFNNKAPVKNSNYKIDFSGDLLNSTGDIENLFEEFDKLTAEIKKNFPNNKTTYNEIPKTIDFNQKYYTYPTNFSLSAAGSANANSAKKGGKR